MNVLTKVNRLGSNLRPATRHDNPTAMQRDAAVSQAELAEQAGVSPSLVSRRLSRLRDAGVLRATVGLVDPESAGLTCAAIIRIRLKDHAAASVKAFRDLVTRMSEVTLCVMLTGEADYLIKIVARDLPHFQEIVQSKLLRCAAIQSSAMASDRVASW